MTMPKELLSSIFAIITFSRPEVLFFTSAILIPIIVHLFNLRRIKKVQFSNTALLRRVREESSAKRKPKELLILACRILAILCFVVAFAQPILKDSSEEASLGDTVLLYLDNSPSMAYSFGSESLFDQATSYAQTIATSYPEQSPFYFIENNYSNSIYTEFTAESLGELLTEVNISNVGRNIGEVLNRSKANEFAGDFYLVSDFSDFSEVDRLLNDTLNQYYLVPTSVSERENIYIDTVYLENTFLSGSFANSLKIELKAINSSVTETNAKIFFDDQLAGTVLISFDNNGFGNGVYEIPQNQEGLENIRLEIEDASFLMDNTYYLSINSLSITNVVEVYGDSSTGYVSSLFRANEFFSFERADAGNLNNELIQGADIVIVNGVSEFSNQLYNTINQHIENGGTVVVIPSPTNRADDFAGFDIDVVLDTKEVGQLASPDFNNPFFEGVFAEANTDLNMPDATMVFRLMNAEYALLNFKNGRPFLGKVAETGNVFFFSSPFNEDLTGFPNHALFVPVMYKLALGSKSSFSKLYHFTDDQLINFPLANASGNGVFHLKNDELEFTPDQRVVGSNLIMEIPKDVVRAGTFKVYRQDEEIGSISFNLPKSESLVGNYVQGRLRELAASADHIHLIEANDPSEFKATMEASLVGLALWRWAIALALLFLFVEIILIRYL